MFNRLFMSMMFLLMFAPSVWAQGNQQESQSRGGNEEFKQLKSSQRQQQNGQQQNSFQIVGPIRVQILPDMIVVTGTDLKEVKRIEALIKQMMNASAKSLPKSQLFRLKNAHAAAVAPWVQHLYDKTFSGRKGDVTVTAKNQTELLFIGARDAVDEAIRIAKSFDK